MTMMVCKTSSFKGLKRSKAFSGAMKGASVLLFIILVAVSGHSQTAYQVIVGTTPGANITSITGQMGGRVLDSMPGGTYLLSVTSPPSRLPNGATYIEYAGAAGLNGIVRAAVKVKARTVPTFYSSQPSSKLLEFTVAKAQSQGKGIVVADIDSLVDYSHPALKGHLTTGYDFIIGATTSTANLN